MKVSDLPQALYIDDITQQEETSKISLVQQPLLSFLSHAAKLSFSFFLIFGNNFQNMGESIIDEA